MAFPFRTKKRGLFGPPVAAMPSGLPTGGMVDPSGTIMGNAPSPFEMSPQEPRAGLGTRLLGKGWEDKAFALGGILQGDPSAAYAMRQQQQAQVQAQQQAAAQQAQAERERAQGLADWRWKEDYKTENGGGPAIRQNYDFIAEVAGEDAAKAYVSGYGQRPEEPRMVSTPQGTFFGTMDEIQEMLRGGGSGAPAPARPVGGLKPMGGPTQPASGGFR